MKSLVILILLLFTTQILATEKTEKDLSLSDIFDLSLVTASRVEESTSKAPGTVVVVTKKQIEEEDIAS